MDNSALWTLDQNEPWTEVDWSKLSGLNWTVECTSIEIVGMWFNCTL